MSKPVSSSSTGRLRQDSPRLSKTAPSGMAKHGITKSANPSSSSAQSPPTSTQRFQSVLGRGKAPLSANAGFRKNISVPSHRGSPARSAGKPVQEPAKNVPITSVTVATQSERNYPEESVNQLVAEKESAQQEVVELRQQLKVAREELAISRADNKKLLEQNSYLPNATSSFLPEQSRNAAQNLSREPLTEKERIMNLYVEELLDDLKEREQDSQNIIDNYKKYGPLPGGDDMTTGEKMNKYREEARSRHGVAPPKTELAIETLRMEFETAVEDYGHCEEELNKPTPGSSF